ncbi:MAG: PLP-dependent transferase, partial [Phycisphaerales bacterium]|nr:PLP-dependent transferase [Phycisphaerales bacterium]
MVARLEGSTIAESVDPSCGGFAFASGMAATCTVLDLIDAGSHIVAMDDLYGGTTRLLRQVRQRTQGLEISFVDLSKPSAIDGAMRKDTALVWIETPTNPTLKLADIKAIADGAHKANPKCIVAVDNTFATPINQRPLVLGADVVVHSVTKYLNGHSDVIGGIVVTGRTDLAERIRFIQKSAGGVLGPFDSYLTLRGIKTLGVRLARHNASALRIAQFLESHEGVERVIYPGLASHPQHALAKRQMAGGTGMITFFIKGGLDAARTFLENVRIFSLAESLGGVESLIEHPAIMTHASVPPEMRAQLGISDALIRLSVGVEDCEDLIADLEGAFSAVQKLLGVKSA